MIGQDNEVRVVDAFDYAAEEERKSERRMPLACNMRRTASILDVSDLIERVKCLFFRFFALRRPVAGLGRGAASEFLAVAWCSVESRGAGRARRA